MRGHAAGPFDRLGNLRVQAVLIMTVGLTQQLYIEASPTNPVLMRITPNVNTAVVGGTNVLLIGTPITPNLYYASGDVVPGTGGFGTEKKFELIANTTLVASLTSAAIAATGTLTVTSITSADTQTVTIGGVTYTFNTSLTNTANNVLIGGSITNMMANLVLAINAGSGAGTNYGTGTVANPSVSATSAIGVLTATAKTPGTVGNAIGTTETLSNGAWGASTLAGGANATTTGQINLYIDV